MATIAITMDVGKETSEVVDALVEIVGDIRAGKDLATIASENLPLLLQAIEGADQIDDELKSETRNATIAYAGLRLADVPLPAPSTP